MAHTDNVFSTVQRFIATTKANLHDTESLSFWTADSYAAACTDISRIDGVFETSYEVKPYNYRFNAPRDACMALYPIMLKINQRPMSHEVPVSPLAAVISVMENESHQLFMHACNNPSEGDWATRANDAIFKEYATGRHPEMSWDDAYALMAKLQAYTLDITSTIY